MPFLVWSVSCHGYTTSDVVTFPLQAFLATMYPTPWLFPIPPPPHPPPPPLSFSSIPSCLRSIASSLQAYHSYLLVDGVHVAAYKLVLLAKPVHYWSVCATLPPFSSYSTFGIFLEKSDKRVWPGRLPISM